MTRYAWWSPGKFRPHPERDAYWWDYSSDEQRREAGCRRVRIPRGFPAGLRDCQPLNLIVSSALAKFSAKVFDALARS